MRSYLRLISIVVPALLLAVAAFAESSPGLDASFRQALSEGQLAWAGMLTIFAGLLTALSPCVYPLIPITLSIMGTRRHDSHLQGFSIAAAYVFGMVLVYSALGILFASLGWIAGSSLQNPWIAAAVSLLFIGMSLSMFGAFELVLPQSVINRVTRVGGTGDKGAFMMGLVAGVIAAPCTGPILTFILTLIASDGNLVNGTILMMLYGLGVGLPFLVLGTFSSMIGRLPKSGPWMDMVKNVFGIIMLGVGFYYLQFAWRMLHDWLNRLAIGGVAWSLFLIALGVLLGALRFSVKKDSLLMRICRGSGVLGIAIGICGIANMFLLMPQSIHEEIGGLSNGVSWHTINHQNEDPSQLVQILEEAKRANRPVVVDFYADWCVACKELDRYTYSSQAVQKGLARFVLIKVDVTRETENLRVLQQQFNVIGLPTVVFIDSKGNTLVSPRLFGFIEAEPFRKTVESIQ